jgi:hypothetical protein
MMPISTLLGMNIPGIEVYLRNAPKPAGVKIVGGLIGSESECSHNGQRR